MTDWLALRAEADPDRPAIIAGEKILSYRALDARAEAVARRMALLGIRGGDRVAALAGNHPETVALVHALPRLGAVLVPLNSRLAGEEIIWQLDQSGARLLLHGPGHAAIARRAASELPALVCEPLAPGAASGGAPSKERIAPRPSPPPAACSLHTIIYTSGTTGRPKGAMLTYGNHLASAEGFARRLGAYRDDRWLLVMPLCHVGGLAILMRAVLFGAVVILQERFDAARVIAAVATRRVTLLSLVPVMLRRMFDADPKAAADLSSLRCVLLGGALAPPDLLAESLRRKIPVAPTYGLTECASQVATLPPRELNTHMGSAGRALPGVDLRITAADGRASGPGQAGEICVRGPVVSPGYWGHSSDRGGSRPGGWFCTGDLGRMDENGVLTILDRREDLVISGGENVYPAEVERALAAHPDVLEAAVAGRADDEWGAVVVGMVVRCSGARVDEKALIAYCRGRLAAYKAPRMIRFVDRLPRNSFGKVMRREVARAFETRI